VDRFEMMTCYSEQVVNRAVDREKSLHVCRRFETTHPAFLLPSVLVGDFSSVVVVWPGSLSDGGEDLSVRRPIASQLDKPAADLTSTERWRKQVAAEEVVHAQDQGSPQTSFSRAGPASDCPKLLPRSEHRLGVFEGRRGSSASLAGGGRLGRCPPGCGFTAEAGQPGQARPAIRPGV